MNATDTYCPCCRAYTDSYASLPADVCVDCYRPKAEDPMVTELRAMRPAGGSR